MISVLVVDDDSAFRDLARRVLSATGLSVVGEADSVATAMAAAKELQPDALLVDMGLPDGDGIALARELADLPWRPRVVLTSIDADAASPREIRWSGANGFAPKDELPSTGLRLLLGSD